MKPTLRGVRVSGDYQDEKLFRIRPDRNLFRCWVFELRTGSSFDLRTHRDRGNRSRGLQVPVLWHGGSLCGDFRVSARRLLVFVGHGNQRARWRGWSSRARQQIDILLLWQQRQPGVRGVQSISRKVHLPRELTFSSDDDAIKASVVWGTQQEKSRTSSPGLFAVWEYFSKIFMNRIYLYIFYRYIAFNIFVMKHRVQVFLVR